MMAIWLEFPGPTGSIASVTNVSKTHCGVHEVHFASSLSQECLYQHIFLGWGACRKGIKSLKKSWLVY